MPLEPNDNETFVGAAAVQLGGTDSVRMRFDWPTLASTELPKEPTVPSVLAMTLDTGLGTGLDTRLSMTLDAK